MGTGYAENATPEAGHGLIAVGMEKRSLETLVYGGTTHGLKAFGTLDVEGHPRDERRVATPSPPGTTAVKGGFVLPAGQTSEAEAINARPAFGETIVIAVYVPVATSLSKKGVENKIYAQSPSIPPALMAADDEDDSTVGCLFTKADMEA